MRVCVDCGLALLLKDDQEALDIHHEFVAYAPATYQPLVQLVEEHLRDLDPVTP